MGVAISGLTAASTIAEADVFEIEQSGISKKVTKTQLRSLLYTDPALSITLPKAGDSLTYNGTDWVAGVRGGWRTIDKAAYTEQQPLPSTSTITFAGGGPLNGVKTKGGEYFAIGSPVRVEIGTGLYYYGICTAISDILLTMSGMTMPTTTEITSLAVGTREMVKYVEMIHPATGYQAVGSGVLINKGFHYRWRGATGYLVSASCAQHNTGAGNIINFKMNAGTNVLTTGITVAAGGATTNGAFTDSGLGNVIAANAAISDAQTITAILSTAGAAADYLVACLTFIVP